MFLLFLKFYIAVFVCKCFVDVFSVVCLYTFLCLLEDADSGWKGFETCSRLIADSQVFLHI